MFALCGNECFDFSEDFMKKYRLLSALIALLLLFGTLSGAVWAEPEEVSGDESAAQTEETLETAAPTDAEEGSNRPVFRDYSTLFAADEYTANCKAALLIERNSNTVIYSLHPTDQMYPASLTKIMTCLVAIEKCAERGKSLDDLVTVSASAFADMDPAGSTAGIQPGDVISLRELLYCMMIESANESCNIVAEYLAGDVDTYVSWMNERAKELGCGGTHFANTHGLHDPNHYTTAEDLAIITEKALEDELFRTIVESASYTVEAEQYSGERSLHSTNYLIREAFPEYYYAKARGVKTGYTSAAGRCLITTASDGNLDLLAVVLGTQDDEYAADGLRYRSFVEAKNLLEYGFDHVDYVQVLSKLDLTAQVVVTNGDVSSVVLYPSEDLDCLLPQDYDKELITTSWTLDGNATKLDAPLEAGQKVGTITVYYQNVAVGSTALETLTEVRERTSVENVVAGTSDFFKDTLPNFLRSYWWIFPALLGLIVLLFIALIVRNNLLRRRRREQLRRRRQQQNREQ